MTEPERPSADFGGDADLTPPGASESTSAGPMAGSLLPPALPMPTMEYGAAPQNAGQQPLSPPTPEPQQSASPTPAAAPTSFAQQPQQPQQFPQQPQQYPQQPQQYPQQPYDPGAAWGYGQGYPQNYYGYGYPQPQGTNGMAIAALVCGLCGLLCLIPGVVGFILGLVSLSQIKRTGQNGRGMAIAGAVTGALFTVGYILLMIFVLSHDQSVGNGEPAGLLLTLRGF